MDASDLLLATGGAGDGKRYPRYGEVLRVPRFVPIGAVDFSKGGARGALASEVVYDTYRVETIGWPDGRRIEFWVFSEIGVDEVIDKLAAGCQGRRSDG
ncbi:MAG: hypothetical protein K0U84_13535 [Actinomycetia bacterium]|nr:hypothetical protein [Actinomycetes bacterium]